MSFVLNNISKSIISKSLTSSKKSRNKFLNNLSKYFANSFLNENDYSISSFLGHNLIYNMQMDMIAFPSIQDIDKNSGVNFAVNPKTVGFHMKIHKCYDAITAFFEDNIALGITQVAKINNGSLEWYSPESHDELFT